MWQLNKNEGKPIYQEIVALVLNYIDQGQLLPGEKMPSERKLADYLGVNRSTVVHALDELVAMGVILRKPGSGTHINDGKWGIYRGSAIDWRQYLNRGKDITDGYPQKAQEILTHQPEGQIIDAYSGDIPLGLVPELTLPTITWKSFLKEEKSQDAYGYQPLRSHIVQRLNQTHALGLDVANLMLTPGTQQALLLLIQVLLKEGEALAIESPSSFYQLSLFQAAGIRVYGIPVDEEGLNVDKLEEQILKKRIKLVLVNPNFQNPTGTTMSLKRRKALLRLCRNYQLPLIEDDVFGELFFKEEKQPTLLKKLDPNNVIYIGSFSKILGATTKIGWVNAPVKVLDQMAKMRHELDLNMSIFPQVLALKALENKNYESQMSDLRQILFQRMTALVTALDEELTTRVDYYLPEGGCYLWLTFKERKILQRDYDDLLHKGVIVTPGSTLGGSLQSMRLNFSRLTPEASLSLAKILEQVFK